MALDYSALGKRISNFRNASGFTQEQFCEKLNMSRKHISQIEAATSRPSLEALVDIANLLGISADDLLVDSLTHSASTADSEIHRLLLDCNTLEQEMESFISVKPCFTSSLILPTADLVIPCKSVQSCWNRIFSPESPDMSCV